MKRTLKCLLLVLALAAGFTMPSPAPIVYRPGEGWVWEPVGGEDWVRTRAKDQLEVAQKGFDQKDYDLGIRAARRVVQVWPLSDYAPSAEYLLARCHEAQGNLESAFKEYQSLLQKYPKGTNYDEVVQRQFEICNQFLAGKRFKLWGMFPTFSNMVKTSAMYEKVIDNGPYSAVAPQAQMNIGAAQEKRSRFLIEDEPFVLAAKAYERAADRYFDRPKVAADALFSEGLAYEKQARAAEYDQGTAGKAISIFSDFMVYFPNDPRVKEGEKHIAALRDEQARGNFEIARYYEKRGRWLGARMYYNEVVRANPNSAYSEQSLARIAALNNLIGPTTTAK